MRRTVLTVAGAGTLVLGAGGVLAGRSKAEDVEQYQLRLQARPPAPVSGGRPRSGPTGPARRARAALKCACGAAQTAVGRTAERAQQAGQAALSLLRALTDSFSGAPVAEGASYDTARPTSSAVALCWRQSPERGGA